MVILMGELDITYNAIDANKKLSEPVKGNVKELMTLFNRYYPEIDLSNFNDRVQKLDVKKGNKYLIDEPLKYMTLDNAIYLNEKKLMKDEVSGMHSMMYSLINMASAKDYYYGFDNTGDLRALNTGATLLMVNTLLGSPEMSVKVGQQVSTGQPIKMPDGQEYYTKDDYTMMYADTVFQDIMHLSADELLNAYFNNKPEIIYNKINELNNSEILLNSIKEMSYAVKMDNVEVMVDCFDNLNEKKSSLTKKQNVETLEEETVKKI